MSLIAAAPQVSLGLDNSVLTHYRTGLHRTIRRINDYFHIHKRFPAIPAITIFEATFGIQKELARKSISSVEAADYQQRIDQFVSQVTVLPFDQTAAGITAYVFGRLSNSERKQHLRDLLVIATVIAHQHGLATENYKDAKLIATHLPPSTILRVADWRT